MNLGPRAGEKTEYGYRRFAAPGKPEIHIAFYTDGDAMGGELVASCINGEWRYV